MAAWSDTFSDTDDLTSVEFLQMFVDHIRPRVLAAGFDFFQGGSIPETAQTWQGVVADSTSGKTYTLTIVDSVGASHTYSYTSTGSDTTSDIAAQLITLVNADSSSTQITAEPGYFGTIILTGTPIFTVTAAGSGTWRHVYNYGSTITYYVSATLVADDGTFQETPLSNGASVTLTPGDLWNPLTTTAFTAGENSFAGVDLSWSAVSDRLFYTIYSDSGAPLNTPVDGIGQAQWQTLTAERWADLAENLWAELTPAMQLVVVARTMDTSWQDNGSAMQEMLWFQDSNSPIYSGLSDISPPVSVTATQTAASPAYTVQAGDDVQLGGLPILNSWFYSGSPSGRIFRGSGIAGLQSIVDWLLSESTPIGPRGGYVDPTADLDIAVYRPLLADDYQPYPYPDDFNGQTVLESLLDLDVPTDIPAWSIYSPPMSDLLSLPPFAFRQWRRKRPREINDLNASYAVFESQYMMTGGVSYGSADTGMLGYLLADVAGEQLIVEYNPDDIATWGTFTADQWANFTEDEWSVFEPGSSWLPVVDQIGTAPDILDSDNDPGGGYWCAWGICNNGDYIGPWLWNQLRDIVNLMTRTAGSTPSYYSPLNNSPNATILDPSYSVPGPTPSSYLPTSWLSQGGSAGAASASAAVAAAKAASPPPTVATGPINSFGTGQSSNLQHPGPSGHAYDASVVMSSWKWALNWNWSGVGSTVNFIVAAAPDEVENFDPDVIIEYNLDTTTASTITVGSRAPELEYDPTTTPPSGVYWNVFESKDVSAGDGTFQTVTGDTIFNSGLDPSPSAGAGPQFYGSGASIIAIGYVIDWSFDD